MDCLFLQYFRRLFLPMMQEAKLHRYHVGTPAEKPVKTRQVGVVCRRYVGHIIIILAASQSVGGVLQAQISHRLGKGTAGIGVDQIGQVGLTVIEMAGQRRQGVLRIMLAGYTAGWSEWYRPASSDSFPDRTDYWISKKSWLCGIAGI